MLEICEIELLRVNGDALLKRYRWEVGWQAFFFAWRNANEEVYRVFEVAQVFEDCGWFSDKFCEIFWSFARLFGW